MSNFMKKTCMVAVCISAGLVSSIAMAQLAKATSLKTLSAGKMSTSVMAIKPVTTVSNISKIVNNVKGEVVLLGDNFIDEDEIVKMLDGSIPQWDSSILKASSHSNPVGKLSFDNMAEVLNDKIRVQPPAGATQILGSNSAFRLDRTKGKVRYVNRDRAWNYKVDASRPVVKPAAALRVVDELLSQLGIPQEELGKPLVRTQMASGAKAGAGKAYDHFEMYSLTYLQRFINGLLVVQSDVKVAINNRGEVQRMGLEWPEFSVNQEAKLRDREAVLREAARDILAQDADSKLTLTSNLAYAQVGGEKAFKPVAVIMVNSLPTPYQMIVELSDSAAGGDK